MNHLAAISSTVCILTMTSLCAAQAPGPFEISDFTIDGGGGVSMYMGMWSVFGTIGQCDAGNLLTGGAGFSVDGGFWSGAIRPECSQWLGLGSGLYGGGGLNWGSAVLPFNGDIIVGGYFTLANSQPANYVARWNGSSWATMGSG